MNNTDATARIVAFFENLVPADAERIQMPATAERVWRMLARDFDPPPLG